MNYGSSDVILVYSFKTYDRSAKVCWLLEELGVPYRREMLDWRETETGSDGLLTMNPMGAVPVLKRGDFVMFESGAICAFLADEFPDRKLAPPPGDPERAAYLQWAHFAVATVESACDAVDLFDEVAVDARPPALAHVIGFVEDALAMLSLHLAGNDYLVGDRFTAADIALAYPLYMLDLNRKLGSHPELGAYLARLEARPAAARARFFSYAPSA